MTGRARLEADLIKPADNVSCAKSLNNLKRKMEPEELRIKIEGVRETRDEEVSMELWKTPKGHTK